MTLAPHLRTGALVTRSFRSDDHRRDAGDRIRPLADVGPGFAGTVRCESVHRDPPALALVRDHSGRLAPKRFLAASKQQHLDLLVEPDGLAGLHWDCDAGFAVTPSIADRDGRPLVDGPDDRSTLAYRRLEAQGLIAHGDGETRIAIPTGIDRVAGTVFVTALFDGYWHWHCELLPQLAYLAELRDRLGSGPLRIVSPQRLNAWQQRSLALFGLDRCAKVRVRRGEPVRADGVLVALRHPSTQPPRRARVAFDRIRESLGHPPSRSGRRLYISRADAATRRVLNEDALRPELERLGFEIVTPTALPYDGTVRLFSEAAVCVGPHGAGFAHSGFMPEGSLVVEVICAMPKLDGRGYLARLAAVTGLRYGVICLPEATGPAMDFTIPPDLLIPELERLLARVPDCPAAAGSAPRTPSPPWRQRR